MTESVSRLPCPWCGSPLAAAAAECPVCGHRIALGNEPIKLLRNGELRVRQRLGGGGMGALYLAEDVPLRRYCVVKELQAPTNRKQRAVFEAMFHEEAKLLARVSRESQAVPRYYDAFMDSGSFYIALEFVPGASLHQYAAEHAGRLPIAEVIEYATQVVEVLEVIHHLRPEPIVHGDITPSNLILRPDGRIILIDFGLARREVDGPGYIPAHGAAFGTPGYTAMEQWEGAPSPASDIFALGATMHRLISGRDPRDPFRGLAQVNKQDLSRLTTFPPISLLAAETPPVLESLIMQMLRRRASERPTTQEVKTRLARLAATITS